MTQADDPITLMHNASEKDIVFQGLTKREYFAAMAMQGLIANCFFASGINNETHAIESVKIADALINALNQTK
jgi:hypothetical protein